MFYPWISTFNANSIYFKYQTILISDNYQYTLSCHFDVFVVNDEDKEGDEEEEKEADDGTILYMAPPVCDKMYI